MSRNLKNALKLLDEIEKHLKYEDIDRAKKSVKTIKRIIKSEISNENN